MKKITTALTLSFACTVIWAIVSFVIYHNKISPKNFEMYGIYPASIGICAIITALFYDGDLKSLGFNFPKTKYVGIAVMVAFVASWLPFLLNLIADRAVISGQPVFNQEVMTAGLPLLLLLVLAEEIMWRGVLLTNFLKKYGFRKSSAYIGVTSAFSKLPLFLFTIQIINPELSLWFAVPMFIISTVATSFIASYLRILSKSIWPSILMLGLITYFMIAFLAPLEVPVSDTSAFFTADTGIFYTLTLVIGAVVFTGLFYKSSVRKRVVSRRIRLASMLAEQLETMELSETEQITEMAGI
ncbi:CPBP family glutamic-type intramembrane protease [Chitinophagaceae bacterium MMS25-I14]